MTMSIQEYVLAAALIVLALTMIWANSVDDENFTTRRCSQVVDIPGSCLAADPSQRYFSSRMCTNDLDELCNNPNVVQQLCDNAGNFVALDGSTPCCTICQQYKKSPQSIGPHPPPHYSRKLVGEITTVDGKLMFDGQLEKFKFEDSSPPFLYPTDIQQPAGPRGWGYRDPQATYQTLLWEQNQPAVLLPDYNALAPLGFLDMSVPSAPVEKKYSPFEGTSARPVVPYIRPRPVAHSNYANWASTLQA